MKTFYCLNRVRHDKKLYQPGDEIQLDDKNAEQLLSLNAITKHNPNASAEAKAKEEADAAAKAEAEAKAKEEADKKQKSGK